MYGQIIMICIFVKIPSIYIYTVCVCVWADVNSSMADIWSRSSTVDAYICARYVNIRSPETDAVWHYIELMDGLHLAVERGIRNKEEITTKKEKLFGYIF